MWLRVLACLLVAAPSIQELMISEDALDDLSNGKFIDIARIEDQEDEVCTNNGKCNKKGGTCISREDTCNGDSYTGKNWCANSNTCQCCVNIDCQSRTNTACSALNGKCIGINDVCDGQVANHRVFCKNPSTCKCCFPKEISKCEQYTCGLPNLKDISVEHGCSESHTELVGGNTTFTSSNNINITEKTIGIRFLPSVLPEIDSNKDHTVSNVNIRFEAPSYKNGFFTIRVTETCQPGGCKWSFTRNKNEELTLWSGRSIDCLPKNEWILLSFRTYGNDNSKLYASLNVRGRIRHYGLGITDISTNDTVAIKADVRDNPSQQGSTTKQYTELSLDCNGID